MIVQRITLAVVSIALMAAAAAIAVFAAAFALYALLRDILTPAGAAGAVVLAAAILTAAAGFMLSRLAKAPTIKPARKTRGVADDNLDRVMQFARDKPYIAAGAAVAAGLLAIANPAIVTAAMRAFLDPRTPPRR